MFFFTCSSLFVLFLFLFCPLFLFLFLFSYLFCPFLFIFCYQSQLRKSTASVSSIASGPKDPSKDVRMALHQSQEVLAMAAAAAAKGPVALPQKDVCIGSLVFFCFAFFPYFPRFYILFCFVLFFCYQINIPIVRTPTSSRKPMPSVLNQILNQPSSRSGSPDVLAMAAAAAAVAQAKTELKKDVCIAESFYDVKY